jgi:hypothetical protein
LLRKREVTGYCRPVTSVVLRLLFVLVLLGPAAVAPGGVVFAQGQGGTLTVDSQAVTSHFPDTVDFSLRAHGFDTYRVELNYRLAGDPVTAQVEVPIDSQTANVSVQTTLDLATHYIPAGSEVIYYWTLTGDSNAPVYTPEQTFVMSDGRYHWQTLTDSGKRVSVHWYDGDQSFGRSLLTTASEALGRLQTEIQAGLERPANIWVYSTPDELLSALPHSSPEWVGGQAFPPLSLVLAAIAPGDTAGDEIKRIVPHELSHLLLYQATRNPYNTPPAWMDEGLAVHNQEVQDPSEERAVRDAAGRGTLIPLKALSGAFGADAEVATLSYGESRSVMEFVLGDKRYGPARFARTVAAFKDGVTYDDALKAGLGITVDELDRQWRDSLPYEVKPAATPAPGQGYTTRPGAGVNGDFGTSVWGTAAIMVVMGACLVLFLAGGVLTLVMLMRGRRA